MGYMCDKEIGTVDWDALNFKKSGADYYKEKFPEFGLSVYQILGESTKDKKVIDSRSPHLKITHEESASKFD